MEGDVQEQRADHPTLGSSLLGRGEPLALLEHARLQPGADQVPAGKRAEHGEKVVVVDSVERRGQVRVQHPQPFRVLAAHRVEQGLDRVLTASTRPKPIRFGFEPGLPFGFQRVTHPRLMAPVHDHGNAEWALFPVGLRYVHPLDRQGLPGGDGVVHAHRHLHPAGGSQRDLPVHPGGRAASIALGHLAHADQRVRPGPQHHLLQGPDLGPVLLLRRLEDPSPQPPYSAFVGAPVDGVPVGGLVLGSVHVRAPVATAGWRRSIPSCVQLVLRFRRSPALVLQRLTCPRQQPFRVRPTGPVSGQLSIGGHLEG